MVEIILAFALAMGVALYLLNLTYDFKNMNEDIYQDITYSSDVISITKNIMNDLDRINSGNMECGTNTSKDASGNVIREESSCDFDIEKKVDGTKETRRLQIVKDSSSGTTITYGKFVNNAFVTDDVSYYVKTLQKSLIVGDIMVEITDDKKYLTAVIPVQSLYGDKNYDIKLLVSTLEGVLPESYTIIYHSNYPTVVSLSNVEEKETVSYVGTTTLKSNLFSIAKQNFTINFDDSFTVFGDCIESDIEGVFDNCSPNQYYANSINPISSERTFTFAGWSTSADGEVVYTGGSSISQTEKLLNNQLDLYAKWTIDDFDAIVLPTAQTIDGWEFIGWSSMEDAWGEAEYTAGTPIQPGEVGTITLYAIYVA